MKTLTRNILRTAITVILVILAFVAIFRAWVYYTASPWTRDARFSADIVAIAPTSRADFSGKRQDNQLVKKDRYCSLLTNLVTKKRWRRRKLMSPIIRR